MIERTALKLVLVPACAATTRVVAVSCNADLTPVLRCVSLPSISSRPGFVCVQDRFRVLFRGDWLLGSSLLLVSLL